MSFCTEGVLESMLESLRCALGEKAEPTATSTTTTPSSETTFLQGIVDASASMEQITVTPSGTISINGLVLPPIQLSPGEPKNAHLPAVPPAPPAASVTVWNAVAAPSSAPALAAAASTQERFMSDEGFLDARYRKYSYRENNWAANRKREEVEGGKWWEEEEEEEEEEKEEEEKEEGGEGRGGGGAGGADGRQQIAELSIRLIGLLESGVIDVVTYRDMMGGADGHQQIAELSIRLIGLLESGVIDAVTYHDMMSTEKRRWEVN